MTIFVSITSDNDKWTLSANHDGKKYYGVSLRNPIDDYDWDEKDFIWNEVYPMLLNWKSKQYKRTDDLYDVEQYMLTYPEHIYMRYSGYWRKERSLDGTG